MRNFSKINESAVTATGRRKQLLVTRKLSPPQADMRNFSIVTLPSA
ncbi:12242_t:CDS:2, partial [Funneliformis geosporum]